MFGNDCDDGRGEGRRRREGDGKSGAEGGIKSEDTKLNLGAGFKSFVVVLAATARRARIEREQAGSVCRTVGLL